MGIIFPYILSLELSREIDSLGVSEFLDDDERMGLFAAVKSPEAAAEYAEHITAFN